MLNVENVKVKWTKIMCAGKPCGLTKQLGFEFISGFRFSRHQNPEIRQVHTYILILIQ